MPTGLLAELPPIAGTIRDTISLLLMPMWCIYLSIEIGRMRRAARREAEEPLQTVKLEMEEQKKWAFAEIGKVYEKLGEFADRVNTTFQTVIRDVAEVTGALEIIKERSTRK